jgi:hypothetical protein
MAIDLPNELYEKIISFVGLADLKKVRQTCVTFEDCVERITKNMLKKVKNHPKNIHNEELDRGINMQENMFSKDTARFSIILSSEKTFGAWLNEPHYWKFVSDENGRYLQLRSVCWLEICVKTPLPVTGFPLYKCNYKL